LLRDAGSMPPFRRRRSQAFLVLAGLLLAAALVPAGGSRVPSWKRGGALRGGHRRGVLNVYRNSSLLAIGKEPGEQITYQSWFSRLQDALWTFIAGVVLIIFAIPVLWVNEARCAKMGSLIAYAESECRTVSGQSAAEENRNWLVHLQGEETRTGARVSDDQFPGVAFDSDCIRLRRTVEVYQIVEHERKEEREKLGGGKENIVTYTYSEEWSCRWNDSSSYSDSAKRGRNTKPDGLELGVKTTNCATVNYGEGFVLSLALVEQCTNFVPATKRVGTTTTTGKGGLSFNVSSDDFYYYRVHSADSTEGVKTSIGDARVKFDYVQEGRVTVMALQVATQGSRDSFLPYRLIDRGCCCGLNEDEQKRRLQREGAKTKLQLAEETGCGGCLGCLCCACNLVMKVFAAAATPEILHLFEGSKEAYECIKSIKSDAECIAWIIRLVGWLMLLFGSKMLFQPFLTLFVVVPFVGPFFSQLAGALIFFLCFVTTLVIATMVIIVAYLFYRPLTALVYSLFLGIVVAGFLALCKTHE